MKIYEGKDAPLGDGDRARTSAEVRRQLFVVGRVLFILAFIFLVISFLPAILGRTTTAKVARTKSDISVLCSAIDQFKLDCGRYPTNAEGLKALNECPPHLKKWYGPYLKHELTLDAWGNPYVYRHTVEPSMPSSHSKSKDKDGYKVESFGADGKPGGDGENADLFDGSD